uniref:Uncharacterized protein n=1 Tax=Arundo donax TaxID=35708 RepID=A0A0A8ZMG3_ARUDO
MRSTWTGRRQSTRPASSSGMSDHDGCGRYGVVFAIG